MDDRVQRDRQTAALLRLYCNRTAAQCCQRFLVDLHPAGNDRIQISCMAGKAESAKSIRYRDDTKAERNVEASNRPEAQYADVLCVKQ